MKQPESLQLADALRNLEATGWGGDSFALTEYSEQQANLAAAELERLYNEVTDLKQALDTANAVFKERDRLHEANQAMLEALKICKDDAGEPEIVWKTARDAIAKGESK